MSTLDNLSARLQLEESNLKLHKGNTSKEALAMHIWSVIRKIKGGGDFSTKVPAIVVCTIITTLLDW